MEGATLAVSPFVHADADHLVATRLNIEAEVGLLEDIRIGAFRIASFTPEDVGACIPIIEKYREHKIGLTDHP